MEILKVSFEYFKEVILDYEQYKVFYHKEFSK